jgi:hypothetical protein
MAVLLDICCALGRELAVWEMLVLGRERTGDQGWDRDVPTLEADEVFDAHCDVGAVELCWNIWGRPVRRGCGEGADVVRRS